MLKTYAFLSQFFIFAVISEAQTYVGIWSGISSNTIKMDIGQLSYTEKRPELGVCFGAIGSYTLNKFFLLSIQPGIVHKDYSLNRTHAYSGIKTKFSNTYFQLPLKASMTVGKGKIKGFISTGTYSAYWIACRINGTIPDIFTATSLTANGSRGEEVQLAAYNQKYEFNAVTDNRFEFGLNYGLGVGCFLRKKYLLFFETNKYYSLSSQQKQYSNYQSEKKNRTNCFIIALQTNLKFEIRKT